MTFGLIPVTTDYRKSRLAKWQPWGSDSRRGGCNTFSRSGGHSCDVTARLWASRYTSRRDTACQDTTGLSRKCMVVHFVIMRALPFCYCPMSREAASDSKRPGPQPHVRKEVFMCNCVVKVFVSACGSSPIVRLSR